MARIRILSPVGVKRAEAITVPPLPRDFRTLTIGFLDNTKANFDRLASDLATILRDRHGVTTIVHKKKANSSTPASPELLAEMAKSCDVVFAGSAD